MAASEMTPWAGFQGHHASFHLPPCVGSLLWKAELFGFLVYSKVPQTSSSISKPGTSDYNELGASSLTGRLSLSFSVRSEYRWTLLEASPAWENQSYKPREEGSGCISVG